MAAALNCFQLIKSVLDEAYSEIQGDRDKLISERLAQYRKQYANLLIGKGGINHSDPVSRFAYLYAYVTSNANIVFDIIRVVKPLQDLFTKDQLFVSCLGGGPGSDLMGILKYLGRAKVKPKKVTCFLLDRNKTWNECWCDLDSKVDVDCGLFTNFMELDICIPESYTPFNKYLSADLFTLVYFVSEVYSVKDSAEPFFKRTLEQMKKGAVVMYIDNKDSRFDGWFDSVSAAQGLKVLASASGTHTLDFAEEKTDLGEYYGKFTTPKIQSSISYRVLEKV